MVSTQPLLGALAGGTVAAGAVLLTHALTTPASPVGVDRSRVALRIPPGARRVPAALAAAALVLLATRWPVAAVGCAALVLAWPALFGGTATERAEVARLEGLARWAEALGDTIAGAAGLEHAIPATVAAAPAELRPHVELLAERLRSRMPIGEALRRFADDLDDPAGDLLVAPLLLSAELRGPGLREVLAGLARLTRDQVTARHRILAQRAVTRRGPRVIVVFTTVVVLGTAVLNPDFVAPYATVAGQGVLAVVLGLAAASFAVTRRVARIPTPARFLGPPGRETSGPDESATGWGPR